MSEHFLFGVFPYLALVVAIAGGLYRALRLRDTLTARSSQLLESRLQRPAANAWHWAIVAILLAHLFALVLPGPFAALLGSPARTYVLEVIGLALGLLAFCGVALLVVRRLVSLTHSTAFTDWLLLAALLVQAGTGVYTAFALRFGSAWFLHTATPWLASIFTLQPELTRIHVLPLVVKIHFFNAFVLLALLPLSRLMHVLTVPLPYLWRPPQIVSWRHPHPRLP
ncbi:MAG TPA: respiratory nitrate reductase subunit gamma [Myxococcales bacterium]|nr:respiratory nitrate reductase subunit gamma [Myxococcales bacterium]